MTTQTHERKTSRRPVWRRPSALFVFGALAVSLSSGVALAEAAKDAEPSPAVEVSRESADAMRNIRAARVALFEGETGAATRYIDVAKDDLTEAKKLAPQTQVTVETKRTVGDEQVAKSETTEITDQVPIDAWLGISEDFVLDQAQNDALAKADAHLKAGDHKQAIETLKGADIAVSVTRVLMPVGATARHVDDAQKMMKEDKYYEANLALRAAEAGLVTDEVLMHAPVSKDGKAS